MLTYHLKPHDQQPLYEQLYHAVRADIMSGVLPGGTRLPSKRQLAANLRVSQITVETAYGQLAAEGYIASAPRRGYFVQEQLAGFRAAGAICTAFAADFRLRGDLFLRFSHGFCR